MKRIEFWVAKNEKDNYAFNPIDWRFGINRGCHNNCLIFEFGFFGFTLLKGDCRRS